MSLDLAFAILKAIIPHVQRQMQPMTLGERVACVLDTVRAVAKVTPTTADDEVSRVLDQLKDSGLFDWLLSLVAKQLAGVQLTGEEQPPQEGFAAAIDPKTIIQIALLIAQMVKLFMEDNE